MKKLSSLFIGVSVLPALLVMPVFADEVPEVLDTSVTVTEWGRPNKGNFTTWPGGWGHTVTTGTYNVITGTDVRNIVDGDIDISLEHVHQNTLEEGVNDETGVYGSLFMASGMSNVPFVTEVDSEHAHLQQRIEGNTNITINNGSEIQGKVIGHYFFQGATSELTNSGAIGKTTITLNNSSVGRGLYGVNYGANEIYSGVTFGDIELNVNDSRVTEEVVAAGSNASAGNVVINVRGNSTIGYTSDAASETAGHGWVIAGANRKGARIKSTTINLNPGNSKTIQIASDVNIGSRQLDSEFDTSANSVIGDATLNIFGGGTVNVGGNLRAYHVGGKNALNITDTVVNVGGDIYDEFQTINLNNNSHLNIDGTLSLKQSANVNMTLSDIDNYATMSIGDLDAHGANLNFLISKSGTYNVMSIDNTITDFKWNLNNVLFKLDHDEGTGVITVSAKPYNVIAREIGMPHNDAHAMAAIAESNNQTAQEMSLIMQQALLNGDVDYVKQEVAKINPESSPVNTSVALSVQNHVLATAGERMALPLIGRSAGDIHADLGIWTKGVYNTSKHNGVFSGDTYGTSIGFDTDLNHSVILGAGYSYARTNIDLNTHDVDINSNTLFVYGQYRDSDWFVNGTIAYTMSKYDWNKSVFGMINNPAYHVNALSEQVMGGYHFDNGVTPTAGMRYMNIHQECYRDGITTVGATDATYLTGVAGVDYKYVWIAPETSLFWTPNAHLAVTYDVISDADAALVMIPGATPYTVVSEQLSRLGGEFGVGLTAEYNYLTVALSYDLNLHKDFTSQTGALKLKYKF